MGQNAKRSNSFSPDDDFEDELNDQLQHPQQRNAANARERARMRVLSKAFCRLKTTLPWVPPDTKLSKLDTLRLATSYIAHLRTMLKLSENEIPKHSVQPTNMNWPFNFNVNWDSQGSRADQDTPLRTEWRTYDSKVAHANNFEKSYDKSYDCQHERRNPNHRPRNRRKTNVNEEMDYGVMDTTHEFNYYKPYSYYEPS